MWKQLQTKYLGATIPIINVHGAITPECTEKVVRRLSKISTARAAALAVSVNSPGGLPVQSQIISKKILDFAMQHNLKVHTFARDLAASGGYFVLSAGHHVVADKTSLVGNIGVIIPKVQLGGLLDITSVEHKSLTSNKQSLSYTLNPFHRLTPQEKEQVLKTCGWTHKKFIEHVKRYRGNKIKEEGDVFNGQIYSGEEAVKVGLVDEVGTMVEVLERLYPGSKLEVEQSGSWGNLLGSF